jgi:hypothetical protein
MRSGAGLGMEKRRSSSGIAPVCQDMVDRRLTAPHARASAGPGRWPTVEHDQLAQVKCRLLAESISVTPDKAVGICCIGGHVTGGRRKTARGDLHTSGLHIGVSVAAAGYRLETSPRPLSQARPTVALAVPLHPFLFHPSFYLSYLYTYMGTPSLTRLIDIFRNDTQVLRPKAWTPFGVTINLLNSP